MSGLQDYDSLYQSKISALTKNNRVLENFYYFISGNATLSTCYTYLSYVSRFLNVVRKPVEELSVEDFMIYLAKFNNTQPNSKQYSSSYKIDIYQALKRFSKFLVATRKIKENPMDYIERPKFKENQQTITKREEGYLNEKEIKKYLNDVEALADPEWRWRDLSMIMVFINTGIRASALYKLDIDSINFSDHTIIVTDKEQRVKRKKLSDQTITCLLKWLEDREQLLRGKHINALFISNRRTRISQHAISNIVKKYSININGKNITPHKLRASYGTIMYNKTHDIYFVQKCLDHASPQTSELYVRGQQDRSEIKAEKLMAELFSDNTTNRY